MLLDRESAADPQWHAARRALRDPGQNALKPGSGSQPGADRVGVVLPFEEKPQSGKGIDRLVRAVASDMTRVNQMILARTGSDVLLIPEIAKHLIESGGKRLRPMLTLATAAMCGYRGEGHIRLAASVEFMHTATLLHDDVVDNSEMRRGKKTARLLWGNEASVLVGDFLLGQAFKMMVEVGSLACLDVLSTAAAVIAEGEVMQLAAAKNTATTEDEYLAVIRAKTAALFAAAAEVGPILAGTEPTAQKACRSYGLNLGIAFQLIDDALDYGGTAAKLGKNVGDDFREGKITLPVVLAFRRGSDEERSFWRGALEEGRSDDAALARAIELLRRHRAIEDTIERARHYGAMAKDALALFPPSDMREALDEFVDFCISRAH
jgi:octaprenyl-diphosphate synthase